MEKRKNTVEQMHPKVDGMASIPKIQHEFIMHAVEKRYKTAMAITVALAVLSNLIWVLCVAAGVI